MNSGLTANLQIMLSRCTYVRMYICTYVPTTYIPAVCIPVTCTHTVQTDMNVLCTCDRCVALQALMAHIGLHKVVVDDEEGFHSHPHSPEGLLHTLDPPAKPAALHLKQLNQEACRNEVRDAYVHTYARTYIRT